MRKVMKNIVCAAMALGVSGCTAIHVPQKDASARIQAEKTFLGSKMLTALNTGSYSDFSHDFSMELKESVNANVFLKMKADLAARKEVIAQWLLLDTLDRGGVYRTEVWKIILSRTGNNGKTNVERLFFVTIGRLDGKESVIGFKFDPLF